MGNVIELFKGEKQMTTIYEVAKYFLSLDDMTHKKLQKLCYYAQAWFLALYDTLLYTFIGSDGYLKKSGAIIMLIGYLAYFVSILSVSYTHLDVYKRQVYL